MDKHAAEKISLYLDGALKGRELEEFEAHIRTCGECAGALAETKRAVEAARNIKTVPLPADFYAKLNRKLDEIDDKRSNPWFSRVFVMRSAAAVLSVLMVGVIVYRIENQPGIRETLVAEKARTDDFSSDKNKGLPAATPASPGIGRGASPAVPSAYTQGSSKYDEMRNKDYAAAQKLEEERVPAESPIAADAVFQEVTQKGKVMERRSLATEKLQYETSAKSARMKSVSADSEERMMKKSGISLPAPKEPANTVIKDEVSLRAYEQMYNAAVKEPVDFSGQMILAVYLGERPTAGYAVEITSVKLSGSRIIANYKETAPAEDSITSQVLTYPHTYKIVNSSDLPVVFVKEK